MSTLLLRLAAPMQSWGVDSKFDRRGTGRIPSKSGVVGLCAAALGYRRGEDEKILRLAHLNYGVRIDRPGNLLKDFHMAHEELFWDPLDRSKINRGKKSSSYLTARYYLSDAAFLVGLEGEENFLNEIEAAIRAPMFPLFLGRRSCPPEGRVSLGVAADSLRDALSLARQPLVARPHRTRSGTEVKPRLILDADSSTQKHPHFLRDLPQSFNPEHRKYEFRCVCEFDVPEPALPLKDHDYLAELEE